jgi:GNAT superfamily N-acetyltransferase
MKILTYDDLAPGMEADRALLNIAAFGGTFPRRSIELWRTRSTMLADYVGLFASEGGRLVGQVYVLRIPYTFRDGTVTISGLAGVSTRPDRARGGVARTLLSEVHRRERSAGIRFITLWTNRSWGAHRLYEHLGYRDVYSSPWAIQGGGSPRGPSPSALRVRPARPSDLPEVEALHAREAKGRLGFRREPNGYLRTAMLARELHPEKELLVVRQGKELAGYAHVDRNPYRTLCGELVASTLRSRRALIAEVARLAKGTPYGFQHTPVTDAPRLFRPPAYSSSPRGWWGFMAAELGRRWTPEEAVHAFATDDPRFLCLAGDRF